MTYKEAIVVADIYSQDKTDTVIGYTNIACSYQEAEGSAGDILRYVKSEIERMAGTGYSYKIVGIYPV